MALQEVLNSSIWVIKDDKSNYQPLYGQFLYTLNTDASGDGDKGILYVGNGTEWINVMGTALSDTVEYILETVPFEQIDNKTIFDAINEKANKATTLGGYGIEDAYTKTTIDAIILALESELNSKQDKLTAGNNISITGNKISVTGLTKASVGLDQVDNTSDADKPISTATQAALDLKADKSQVASELAGKQDKLTAGTNISISDANEISVVGLTKASVGLENVDNTSDANKPISTATQEALDLKQDKLTAGNGISIENNVISATGSGTVKSVNNVGPDDNGNVSITTANIPNLSISEDGSTITIGDKTIVPLTADSSIAANKVVGAVAEATKATQDGNGDVISATYAKTTELANKQDKLTAGTNITISETNEISVTGLTKASVGLDKVDNTSDAEKPISTATQTALNAKQDVSNLVTSFGVTPSDTKYPSEKLVNDALSQTNQRITGIENDTQALSTNKQDKLTAGTNITITGTTISAKDTTYTAGTNIAISDANAISVTGLTKASVGLGNVDNTSDANKPISTATQTALDAKQDTLTSGDNISIEGNKISVTGVYTSTQVDGLLANKANKSTTLAGYGITDANISDGTITLGDNSITPLTANSTISADKVTGLTKASVGLGNVDNTSDANKPISTATQAALDTKQGKLTAGDNVTISDTNVISSKDTTYTAGTNITISEANAISVTGLTKASVGLENVDNTSDANKPISTATQAALDAKQDKLTAGTNVTITGSTISAKDTTYTAGTNIAISNDNAISVTGLTKASVGLGNVDNTSDANKPISTATQAALDAKQDIANLVTTIDSTSDDTHYPSTKAVYDYTQAGVTSTVETTVTPTTAQTATAITGALAKKARVVVVPSLANVGAIYIKESDTYSSINPIYPDPTNNVYEFTNMQNVKVFVDSVGDSVDLVIEYRG